MSIQVMIQMLGQGFLVSLQLFVLTLLGSIPLGIPVAFMRMSKIAPLRWIARIYISVMRGTPLMLQMFAITLPRTTCLAFRSRPIPSGRRAS